MEFNFRADIHIKLTEEGYKKALEIHKDENTFIDSFKAGFKELIIDELKPDIDSGLVEIDINVVDY